MLRLETIHKGTFKLLKSLAVHGELHNFALAGGTALALNLGHRISIDLDFFTNIPFDSNELFEHLKEYYDISYCSKSANSLSLFIKIQQEDIKVDFIRHNYPLIGPIEIVDKIRIFSLKDIAAMKLNAIANRGAKKDFYDINALLNCFSLQELLDFFRQKYEQMNSFTVAKSLVYFADADLDPEPISLTKISWSTIKNNLKNQVQTFF